MASRLEFKDVTKRFGATLANDRVSLSVAAGEVHALLGENGAGKTTLTKIAYGVHEPDSGHVRIDGRAVHLHTPQDAIALGVGLVHQHFALVPTLSVVKNVVLGGSSMAILTHLDRAAARVDELSRAYGLEVDPAARVEDLPVAVQQRVEILKLLYRNPQIVILDEPTSLLAPPETRHLFRVMRQWAEEGRAVVFITHKLREAFAVADRLTVLRRGRVAKSATVDELDEAAVARLMVGRDMSVTSRSSTAPRRGGNPLALEVRDITVLDDRGHPAVDGLSLELRAGDILGLAGVEGNGQRELAEALAGLRATRAGELRLLGRVVTGSSAAELAEMGVGLIPEDRRECGVVLDMTIAENLVLRPGDRRAFVKGGLLGRRRLSRLAAELVRDFNVVGGNAATPVRLLSGGNQQKVVLARELHRKPRVLLAAQPTRGLDIAATRDVGERIRAARDSGAAVLYTSTDLDEILAMADRVAVIYAGRIVECLEAVDADRDRIGMAMTGVGVRGREAGVP